MADNSGESFSSTSGLLSGAAPDEAPTPAPALSRLNPSRPRGFRALVRQAAGAADAVPRSQSLSQQVDSPRIGALARSNASMSQASGSPLLGRLGEVSTSSFTEPDDIVPQEQTTAKLPFGNEPVFCPDNSIYNNCLPWSWGVSPVHCCMHQSGPASYGTTILYVSPSRSAITFSLHVAATFAHLMAPKTCSDPIMQSLHLHTAVPSADSVLVTLSLQI